MTAVAGAVSSGAASPGAGTATVLKRYGELADLLASMSSREPAEPADCAAVTPALLHEARMLDSGCFEDWLDGWTGDAVLWVPLSATAHPGVDQSLLLDDHRRLRERVAWRKDPTAWGQRPPSLTTRVVGGIEAWPAAGGRMVARSTLLIEEFRHGRCQQLAGFQIHELAGCDLRRRTKIVVIPALRTGTRNPSFLL